jgi:hypothetical protein
MIVQVGFPTVFLLHVPMRDVHVLQRRVIVLVRMRGEQVPPVLPRMKVVRHVVVLVSMFQGLVLMMALRFHHHAHLLMDGPSGD